MIKAPAQEILLNSHGKRCHVEWENDLKADGRICIENGRIYICQNARSGSPCSNKFGYNRSWVIGRGSMVDLYMAGIRVLVLLGEENESRYNHSISAGDIIKANDGRVLKVAIATESFISCVEIIKAEDILSGNYEILKSTK